MPREQRTRATTRPGQEVLSNPGQLNPVQPIATGPRQTGAGRFLEVMEAVEPNFREAAARYDQEQREAQERMARADALSDAVSGNVDLATAKQREAFSDPHYQDAYMTSRYSLMATAVHDDVVQGIAENRNKPDFDAEGYFRQQLQAMLSEVDDPEYKDLVAEKMAVLHGKFRRDQQRRALEEQADKSLETLQAGANDIAMLMGGNVSREDFEHFRERAADLNRTEEEAKDIWLKAMTQSALDRADLEMMDGLYFLEDDPDFAEQYHAARRAVAAEVAKRANYGETAFRDATNQQVENGTFTMRTVRAITGDDERAQYYTEAQLAAMVQRSRENRDKGTFLQAAPTGWLRDPQGFMSEHGETLTEKERQAVLEAGLTQLNEIYQAQYPNDPGKASAKAYMAFLTKLSESGEYGTYDQLKSQMNTAGGGLRLTDGVAEPSEEFLRAASLYNNLQQLGGGSLLKHHITDPTAAKVFATYHRYTTRTGMDAQSAYFHTVSKLENRVPLDEFRTMEAGRKIDSAVSDLATDVLPHAIRGPIKALAMEYGAWGHDPESAIALAREDFENSHVEVRGQWVRLGNADTSVTPQTMRQAGEAMDLMLEDPHFTGRLKRYAGMDPEEDLDPEDVTFMQHTTNPLLFIPMVNYRLVPAEALKVEDFVRYRAAHDAQQRQEARLRANDDRLGLGFQEKPDPRSQGWDQGWDEKGQRKAPAPGPAGSDVEVSRQRFLQYLDQQ